MMRALVLRDKFRVEVAELPVPGVGEDEVLVRNCCCAVCNATDSKMYMGKHALVTYPSVFGHEGAGVVEAVGEGVVGVKVGDRVLGAGYPASEELGSFWGQYSEYGVCKEGDVIRVPEHVTLEEAAIAHMLGEALNALRISEARQGDILAVIGCGAVGLSILTVLKHHYPEKILVIDLAEEKRDKAMQMGADYAIDPKEGDVKEQIRRVTGGRDVDVVFEAVGAKATYEMAFEILRENGTLVPFGMVEGIMELPFRKLYSKQLQMKWVRSAGTDGAQNKRIILQMMEKGLIQVAPLITGRYPLGQFEQAINSIMEGKEVRVIIEL